jgi:hypothetical protein
MSGLLWNCKSKFVFGCCITICSWMVTSLKSSQWALRINYESWPVWSMSSMLRAVCCLCQDRSNQEDRSHLRQPSQFSYPCQQCCQSLQLWFAGATNSPAVTPLVADAGEGSQPDGTAGLQSSRDATLRWWSLLHQRTHHDSTYLARAPSLANGRSA